MREIVARYGSIRWIVRGSIRFRAPNSSLPSWAMYVPPAANESRQAGYRMTNSPRPQAIHAHIRSGHVNPAQRREHVTRTRSGGVEGRERLPLWFELDGRCSPFSTDDPGTSTVTSMSSENRSIAPCALDSAVPPLNAIGNRSGVPKRIASDPADPNVLFQHQRRPPTELQNQALRAHVVPGGPGGPTSGTYLNMKQARV